MGNCQKFSGIRNDRVCMGNHMEAAMAGDWEKKGKRRSTEKVPSHLLVSTWTVHVFLLSEQWHLPFTIDNTIAIAQKSQQQLKGWRGSERVNINAETAKLLIKCLYEDLYSSILSVCV